MPQNPTLDLLNLVREPRAGRPYERRACLLQACRQQQGEQRPERRSGQSGPAGRSWSSFDEGAEIGVICRNR